jgi:hypothetical protein
MAKQPTVINIPPRETRGTDSDFTELQPKGNIGPIPILPPNTSLEDNARQAAPVETVATWKIMDVFDDGLRKAILDFIDTTREGVKAPQTRGGRSKIMTFNFYGTGTKSIKPGEIGEFSVVFSYPPGAKSSTSTVISPNIPNVVNVSASNTSTE